MILYREKGKEPLEHYFTNNENLKSELRKLIYNYEDVSFEFFSDNGVLHFGHISIDTDDEDEDEENDDFSDDYSEEE